MLSYGKVRKKRYWKLQQSLRNINANIENLNTKINIKSVTIYSNQSVYNHSLNYLIPVEKNHLSFIYRIKS